MRNKVVALIKGGRDVKMGEKNERWEGGKEIDKEGVWKGEKKLKRLRRLEKKEEK